MSTVALIFAGVCIVVSFAVLALAIYTRPTPERPCTSCIHYATGQGKQTHETRCRVGGTCGNQRKPSRWTPIVFTGRCGPQGRHHAPR